MSKRDKSIQDSAEVKIAWDEQFLYVSLQSYDQCLIKEQEGNQNSYIWRNDGMEIYIDPKYDPDSIMDMNDLNCIVDLTGNYTLYTATEERRNNPIIEVPKENNKVEYFFDCKTQLMGSLNDTSDIDNGYIIEFRIPWGPMGVLPEEGDSMRIDICSNDLDKLTDTTEWRSYVKVPDKFYYTSWTGSYNFGFPLTWKKVILVGGPDAIISLQERSPYFIPLVSSTAIFLLSVLCFFLWNKSRRLSSMIEKSSIENQTLLSIIDSRNSSIKKEVSLYNDARTFILEKISSPLKPSDLAENLNISLRMMQRKFKEELDTSPGNFIQMVKLERAAELLSSSEESIKEIAFHVGFTDPNYFSKVFKKFFGLSPKVYRSTM